MSREGYTFEAGAGHAWKCREPGCMANGKGKDYCIDHIERLPYPAQVMAEVAKGAVSLVAVQCGTCGEWFDRRRDVSGLPRCGECRASKDRERGRRYRRERRAS